MNPRGHPLWRVAQQHWLVVAGLFLLLTAVNAGLVAAARGRQALRNTGEGIVKLEADPWDAEAVLAAWSKAGVLGQAEEAVAWDYGLIAGYVAALSIASLAFARRGGWYESWGGSCAWLSLAVGALDAVENVGLLQMVGFAKRGQGLGSWPSFTAAFSWPKWAGCVVVVGFLVVALVSAAREETGASLPAARPS
ncbi:MAG TPA: hypothetical protein VFA20_30240 [Myxococcaceae bacterium]|nr:hypothetical protein [Myxococcaceae bacterium]